jgi:hypothetical protein
MFIRNNKGIIFKSISLLLIVMAALALMPLGVMSAASAETIETNNIDNLAFEAISNNYELFISGTAVDGGGYTTFSSYDAYVLIKAGVDISKWVYDGESFYESVIKLIDKSIINENTSLQSSAKRVAQDYLAAKIMGEDEKALQLIEILKARQSETGEIDKGLYSMYSNLPAYDMLALDGLSESGLNIDNAVRYVLSNKDETGAYPKENADYWIINDFMSTSQAVRVLIAAENSTTVTSSAIQLAINDGMSWLKSNQNEDGSYVAGYDDKVSDTSELICTAIKLGEDPSTYLSSSGKSPIDYMKNNALTDEGFGNVGSTTWALNAYIQMGAAVSAEKISDLSRGESSTTPLPILSYKVQVAVIGKSGDVLFGPRSVSVSADDEFEGTAMSALDATGLDWQFGDTFGFVEEIDGERNSGNNGWMYAVNGKVPNVTAVNKSVSSGDEILWWYSTSAMEGAPDWPTTATAAAEAAYIEETINMLKSYKTKIQDENLVLNQEDRMSDAEAQKISEELENNKSSMTLKYEGKDTAYNDGEISILMEKNVLDKNATITAEELSSNHNPKQFAVKINSSVYEFGPDGTKFNYPVTIGIKVAISENTDIKRLTAAYFDDENNKWVAIPCVIDAENGIITFETDHFTKFAVIETEKRITFEDVNDSVSWAKDAIEILAGREIISGTGNGFEPLRSITRAEFIKIMIKALDYKIEGTTGNIFSDVDQSRWFAGYVEAAYRNNLIKGDQDGKFRPNDSISRYEIAVILSRLNEEKNIENLNINFDDASEVPAWAHEGIKFVVSEKLMNGYEDNTFKGSKPMTRAEVAAVIYRYLNSSLRQD